MPLQVGQKRPKLTLETGWWVPTPTSNLRVSYQETPWRQQCEVTQASCHPHLIYRKLGALRSLAKLDWQGSEGLGPDAFLKLGPRGQDSSFKDPPMGRSCNPSDALVVRLIEPTSVVGRILASPAIEASLQGKPLPHPHSSNARASAKTHKTKQIKSCKNFGRLCFAIGLPMWSHWWNFGVHSQ